MHLLLNSEYSWLKIVLSFTGITSIGNGGWYIFSTFFFYAMIIAWFHIFRNNKMLAAFGVAGSFVALIIVEVLLGFETYFYNTVYFFVVGMFYSFLKKPFDAFVMKNNYIWGAVTLVSLFGFCFLKQISSALYPVWCGCGMLLILCLTMKVKIGNKVLHWLGITIFFNFTLQGIPQTIFTKYLTNNYLIYILVIVTTIVLAMSAQVLFDKKTFLPSKNAK